MLDKTVIRRLFAGQSRGYGNNVGRIFGLAMFELWRRHYKVTL
jgi:hypothetical protein